MLNFRIILLKQNIMKEQKHIKIPHKNSQVTTAPSTSRTMSRDQSCFMSLSFEDMKRLMKKKQKEYQSGLQIEEAKRVHCFLNELEQKNKVNKTIITKRKKDGMKKEIQKYNEVTINNFALDWEQNLNTTMKQLERIENQATKYYQKQIQKEMENLILKKHPSKIKYSSKVLSMEDTLKRLAKTEQYDQALVVQKRLSAMKEKEKEEFIRYEISREQKKIHMFKQKKNKEKQILRDKLSRIYEKQLVKRQKQYDIIKKNVKSYEIDFKKVQLKVSRIRQSESTEEEKKEIEETFEEIQQTFENI